VKRFSKRFDFPAYLPLALALLVSVLSGAVVYRTCYHFPGYKGNSPENAIPGGFYMGCLTLVFSMILTGSLSERFQLIVLGGLVIFFLILHGVIFGSIW
jgi:hypothetical protein